MIHRQRHILHVTQSMCQHDLRHRRIQCLPELNLWQIECDLAAVAEAIQLQETESAQGRRPHVVHLLHEVSAALLALQVAALNLLDDALSQEVGIVFPLSISKCCVDFQIIQVGVLNGLFSHILFNGLWKLHSGSCRWTLNVDGLCTNNADWNVRK